MVFNFISLLRFLSLCPAPEQAEDPVKTHMPPSSWSWSPLHQTHFMHILLLLLDPHQFHPVEGSSLNNLVPILITLQFPLLTF